MKRRYSRKEPQNRASSAIVDSREILARIARILVVTGRTPEELRQEFEEVCGALGQPRDRWEPERFGIAADLPHVITRWHNDEHYLDSEGQPIPLPLRVLRSLAKQVLPSVAPARVIDALINLGGIRRQGRTFLPTGRYLAFNSERSIAFAHALNGLLGMLRTVEHNLSVGMERRIFERTAVNPRFPASALQHFQRKFTQSAEKILSDIDTDMGREEARRRSGPTTRLGVGLYMFEDAPGGRRIDRAGKSTHRARTGRRRPRRRPP